MTKTAAPMGNLSIRDAKFSVWNDEVNQDIHRVMESVKHVFRKAGWRLRRDPETLKHFPTLAPFRLYSKNNGLEVKLSLSGRVVDVQFFQNVQNVENSHGNYYDFDKFERMPYLMQKRTLLMFRRLEAHLMAKFGYGPASREFPQVGPLGSTAKEFAEHRIRTSGHFKPELGHAEYGMRCNCTSRDGQPLNHGDFVYFRDYDGRWGYGQAFYSLNSSWFIVTGRYGYHVTHTGQMYVAKPANLRERDNIDRGIRRLQRELAAAVKAEDFLLAHKLKTIIARLAPPLKLAA